jgi:hypothetical protein
MFKKKSIDGSSCFCPLLPLPKVNPTFSEGDKLCGHPAASPVIDEEANPLSSH